MYNYSLIIPHRNSPELLQRCLDSIPERDDLQIIIVDDNSSEKYVDFTHFPGNKRCHTECVFNKEGKGAGHARNIGLTMAMGKWILFADADDYFNSSFPLVLDKYKNDDETEMVFFNYCKVTESGSKVVLPITRYISNYLNGRGFSEKVLKYSAWSPWSRMMKRSLQLRYNLSFEEIPFGNDMMFVLKATALAKNIRVEEETVYSYFSPSKGSLTKEKAINPDLKMLHLENRLKQRNLYMEVNYRFFPPVWYTEKSLNLSLPKAMKNKYGFKAIYNVTDTLAFLFAKFSKIL